MMETLMSYWWILPILIALAGFKFILRVFFGMVIVPENKIGLITKKFVLFGANKELPSGRIIACNGEAGSQAEPLAPGIKWAQWPWQISVDMVGFTIIPPGKIGLIDARDGAPLPIGHILGRKVECNNYQDTAAFLKNGGQKGKQTAFLTNGVYRINTTAFQITIWDAVVIPESNVGIITALDGAPLNSGHIAGQLIEGHNNFQDFDAYLEKGGQRGLQPQVIQAGSYYINPWAVKVDLQTMTEVPIGHVGVIISYIGEEGTDVTGDSFKHGNLVGKGQRGVCFEPLGPGKYPLNRLTHKIELVPTTNLVLNWANATSESHNLDKHLSTITVRSNDGFPFNLDVSQIIHIPANEAPKVIARFGNMNNLVSQVLEPTIGNYFRNSAQSSDVIAFLKDRKARQDEAKSHISKVLEEYNVHAVDTLIGDIVPPAELMKTLTDRKIAQEEQVTFNTQKEAQEVKQTLEKATAIAKMQPEIVKATQSVEIAQRTAEASIKTSEGNARSLELNALGQAKATVAAAEGQAQATEATAVAEGNATKIRATAEAEKIEKIGSAEAGKILAVGKATAEAYQLQVAAMGGDNFSKLKIIEQIATGKVKVIPEIQFNGTGSGTDGSISALLGMNVLEMVKTKKEEEIWKQKPVTQTLSEELTKALPAQN